MIVLQVKHVTDPDLMVFVTYPMMERGGKPDKYALALLRRLQEDRSATPVVLVTHRTTELFHPSMADIERLLPHGTWPNTPRIFSYGTDCRRQAGPK